MGHRITGLVCWGKSEHRKLRKPFFFSYEIWSFPVSFPLNQPWNGLGWLKGAQSMPETDP